MGGSKKDSELRRQEILGEGASSFAGLLCKACKLNAADMLRDPQACDVMVEVAQAGSSGIFAVIGMCGIVLKYTVLIYTCLSTVSEPRKACNDFVQHAVICNDWLRCSCMFDCSKTIAIDQSPLIDTGQHISCHEDASVYLATPVAAGVLTIHHSSAVHEVREAIAQAATPAPSTSPKAGEC